MTNEEKQMLDWSFKEASKRWPDLMQKCYPRRIIPPSNKYLNTKYYGLSAVCIIAKSKHLDRETPAFIGGIDLSVQRLVEFNVPTYFINESFLRAAMATELPEDFSLSELKWPLEAMLFVLPYQTVKDILGVDIPFITVAHIPAGIYKPSFSPYETNFEVPRIAIHFPVFLGNKKHPQDFGGQWRTNGKLQELIDSAPFLDDTLSLLEIEKGNADKERDKLINDKMMKLGVQVILAMTARPELVEMGCVVRKGKVNHKNPAKNLDELWSANVIGQKYQIQREKFTNTTDKTLRMHWRRGYFRRQHHGKMNLLTKIVWIDPVLVNAV